MGAGQAWRASWRYNDTDPFWTYYGPEVPEVVIEKIYHAFNHQHKFEWVLRSMAWSGLMGCWMVDVFGQQVGIELDGYIHS